MLDEKFVAAYGNKTTKRKTLYNRAIRVECPGGSEVLELLELVSAMRGRTETEEEADKLLIIEDRVQFVRLRMIEEICKKWGIDGPGK